MIHRLSSLRGALSIALSVLLTLWPALAIGQGSCSIYRTFLTGDSLTASELNSLQTTLGVTNAEAQCIDGLGDSNSQFDDTLAPTSSAGARVLSTQLYHDVANLRYVAQHVFGATNWWSVPYENVNFRHRMVRQHFGTLYEFQQAFRAEGHLSSASTRFHFVAIGFDRDYVVGAAHPESDLFLIHVNGANAPPHASIRFKVGIGGDVHVGNTLAVHAAGTAMHAAIFRPSSPGTGISWPQVNHVLVSSGAGEVARFHAAGLALHRLSVLGNNSTALLHVLGTWNTTGAPAGISVDIARQGASTDGDLLALSVHAQSVFRIQSTTTQKKIPRAIISTEHTATIIRGR